MLHSCSLPRVSAVATCAVCGRRHTLVWEDDAVWADKDLTDDTLCPAGAWRGVNPLGTHADDLVVDVATLTAAMVQMRVNPRTLAARAHLRPRTIRRALRGEPIAFMVIHRLVRALAHGAA